VTIRGQPNPLISVDERDVVPGPCFESYQSHNPKVAGSNPAPATKKTPGIVWGFYFLTCFRIFPDQRFANVLLTKLGEHKFGCSFCGILLERGYDVAVCVKGDRHS